MPRRSRSSNPTSPGRVSLPATSGGTRMASGLASIPEQDASRDDAVMPDTSVSVPEQKTPVEDDTMPDMFTLVQEQEASQDDHVQSDTSAPVPTHDLATMFSTVDLVSPSDIPTPDQCGVHLKLLEAFHKLRQDVATTDGLYGIWDRFISDVYPGEGLDKERRQLLLKLREKRWAIYVFQAERRYTVWFQELPTRNLGTVSMDAVMRISKVFEKRGTKSGFRFEPRTLPPLGQSSSILNFHRA
ncbi:MAG: hypothetical protein Q9168_004009 [Polycauliona sp. 1 TL-2023]